jgi:hypothetical protein
MGRLLNAALKALALYAGLLLATAHTGRSAELDLSVELRAVSSDATATRLGGELGKLRYDGDHEGLRFGYLRLGYRADITPTLRFAAEAISYGDHDVNAIDLTEAYLDWRPIPASAWRSRLKVGAFYPEISLENRMRGWRSPYTLSFSAINTWVGEELRTIGAEYNLDWLGLANGHNFEVSSGVTAFGWNDPAGTVVGSRGWALHDRQSTLFGRFANRGTPLPERTVFFDDLDKRAGYTINTSLRYRGLLELRALHYDNRARLGVAAPTIDDATWQTYFDSVGARWTPSPAWTAIAQWLHGRTLLDAPQPANDWTTNAWTFESHFLLVSNTQGRWRYSARYDRFFVQQTASNFAQFIGGIYFNERGHAWTLAVQRSCGQHWNVALEGLQVDSDVEQRALLGQPDVARERQLQLALRYER